MSVNANRFARQVEGARHYAAADKNDPFAFARCMAHIRAGLCDRDAKNDDASYGAEPYTVQRPHPVTGEPFAATEYKNRVRP